MVRESWLQTAATISRWPVRLAVLDYRLSAELPVNVGRLETQDHLQQQTCGSEHGGDRSLMSRVVANRCCKPGDIVSNSTYAFTEPPIGYRRPLGRCWPSCAVFVPPPLSRSSPARAMTPSMG